MNALSIGTSSIRELDGLYSLNDLHKASGGEAKHEPNYFVRLDSTKALVSELEKSPETGILENAGVPAIKTIAGRNGGTYACRELVIAYAAWISAAFHLKVIRVFLNAQAAAPRPAPIPSDMMLVPKNAVEVLIGHSHIYRDKWNFLVPIVNKVLGMSDPADQWGDGTRIGGWGAFYDANCCFNSALMAIERMQPKKQRHMLGVARKQALRV